jgi:chromosome segregation ATPase
MDLKTLLQDHEFSEESQINSRNNNSYVSKDLIKSATVENLISQNEDLMERVKALSRRLASLEDLNHEMQSENFNQKNQIMHLGDQIEIMKEKDLAWKAKVDELETERDKLSDTLRGHDEITSEVERFRKYHEKIRLQVKPYISNLKKQRDDLAIQGESYKNQISLRDNQLKDLRSQMQEVLRHSKNQINEMQKQKNQLVEVMEKQKEILDFENRSLKLEIKELRTKFNKMHDQAQIAIQLENQVIELDRSKSEQKISLETEIIRLQEKLNQQTGDLARFTIENQDLKDYLQRNHNSKIRSEEETQQLRRQLETMRFMWNQKNEESERLSQSLSALEKLNLSLSQKIQEIRNPDGSN